MPELIDEIKEDIKKERLEKLWNKHGNQLISFVILIVVSTAIGVGFKNYSTSKYKAEGDMLYMAYASSSDAENKVGEYSKIEDSLSGSYLAIAKLKKAKLLQTIDRADEAAALYEEIANDSSVPEELQQLSALFKASFGNDEQSNNMLTEIANGDGIFTSSAREKLAFNKLSNNDIDGAKSDFAALSLGAGIPASISGRAKEMLNMIDAKEAL